MYDIFNRLRHGYLARSLQISNAIELLRLPEGCLLVPCRKIVLWRVPYTYREHPCAGTRSPDPRRSLVLLL